MSDARLREFRYRNSTTFQTSFTNAATAYWGVSSAVKLELTAYDASGLVQEGLPDETLKTRLHEKGAPTVGLSKGELSFSTYLTGAESDLDTGPVVNLLRTVVGGITEATNARGSTVTSGSTTTNIAITSANTYAVAGQAVLIGTRGDGRGGGEVRPINATGADWATVSFAFTGAPSSGDAVVFSDTVHYDESAAQEYIETLSIGHSTADQRQTIGGAGTFEIGGTAVGERPTVDVTVACSDHKHVAADSRASFTHDDDPASGTPAFNKSIGMFHLGDYGAAARTCWKAGEFSFSPGMEIEELPCPCGNNGVGGYEQVMSVPTMEVTLLYDEDMLGLKTDYDNGTEKTAMLQLGTAATKTAAIELTSCFIDNLPEDSVIGNLAGVKISLHGDEDYTDSNELRSSVFKIHHF
jgi:hypothetical protein